MIKVSITKLMKVLYYDTKAETRLECYSDTVVIEKDGSNFYVAAVNVDEML